MYHVDLHVNKMLLETCQLLCNAHEIAPYKRTHYNHPCSVWVRSSQQNYLWTCNLGMALAMEFRHRFKKGHASEAVVKWAFANPLTNPVYDLTPFAQAMPEQYRREDAVKAYRTYYLAEKMMLRGKPSKWTGRSIPHWILENGLHF